MRNPICIELFTSINYNLKKSNNNKQTNRLYNNNNNNNNNEGLISHHRTRSELQYVYIISAIYLTN